MDNEYSTDAHDVTESIATPALATAKNIHGGLYKVLYGPQGHLFHISIHTRPKNGLVLLDEHLKQIRTIDVEHILSFERRVNETSHNQETLCVHLDGYALEFGFSTRAECDRLCQDIELAFGQPVLKYGLLTSAFKRAMGNANAKGKLKTPVHAAPEGLDGLGLKYSICHASKLDHGSIPPEEEPNAIASTQYPVIIEGTLHQGDYVTYSNIKRASNPPFTIYKVEWSISRSKYNQREFGDPVANTDSLYIADYMIGHYVMVKVFKAVKPNTQRLFVYSTAVAGPVVMGSNMCHEVLVNSVVDSPIHHVCIRSSHIGAIFKLQVPLEEVIHHVKEPPQPLANTREPLHLVKQPPPPIEKTTEDPSPLEYVETEEKPQSGRSVASQDTEDTVDEVADGKVQESSCESSDQGEVAAKSPFPKQAPAISPKAKPCSKVPAKTPAVKKQAPAKSSSTPPQHAPPKPSRLGLFANMFKAKKHNDVAKVLPKTKQAPKARGMPTDKLVPLKLKICAKGLRFWHGELHQNVPWSNLEILDLDPGACGSMGNVLSFKLG
ncbi:hypothetical protein BdWA1_001429 [Babesia duncani]|uniref:Uncharacterized protein n=1 Tax=Babesia duncani TaxID=323732 RepID=A0AAD9UQY1_9APIC|nr:hypothetical protein BdWA1_001429 [Babesia duncani]